EHTGKFDHASIAVQKRTPLDIERRCARTMLKRDRAPRSHRRHRWRPAGNASEQAGANPAQLLLTDEFGFPARTRTTLRKRGAERTKTDDEFVAGLKCGGDVDSVVLEHVV